MKYFLNICLLICLLTLFFACASAPKPETTTTVTATDTQPSAEYEQAKAHRQTIQKYELFKYAADSYQTAEQSFKTGETAYEKSDFDTARTALNEANAQYLVIITNAFPQYLDTKEKEVTALRTSAEEIKAQVALKDEYKKAIAVWEESQKEKKAGNYEKSAEFLSIAYSDFDAVYKKTKEKKARAEKALNEFNTNIDQVKDLQKQQAPADETEKS